MLCVKARGDDAPVLARKSARGGCARGYVVPKEWKLHGTLESLFDGVVMRWREASVAPVVCLVAFALFERTTVDIDRLTGW